jgi:hypothetical protein
MYFTKPFRLFFEKKMKFFYVLLNFCIVFIIKYLQEFDENGIFHIEKTICLDTVKVEILDTKE